MLLRAVLATFLFALPALAGQLEIAIVQFPESKNPQELTAALAGKRLADITNADRTLTSENYLKGGYVLFAQRVPATANLSSSTRLSNQRADVEGTIASNRLSLTVTLTEGVAAGLRKFSKRIYSGAAQISGGNPVVLSIKQSTTQTQNVLRSEAQPKTVSYCTVLLAQRFQ